MTARLQRSAVALAAVIALGYLGAADAQDSRGDAAGRSAERTNGAASAQTRPVRDARLSQLIGMNVRDPQGRSIGEINDVVLDLQGGRVQYAVLGFGGFMGLGEKLFAFPMNAFKVAANGSGSAGPGTGTAQGSATQGRDGAARTADLSGTHLVLNVPQERLKQAPGFERNQWPDFNDATYRGQIDRFAQTNGARGPAQKNTDLRRGSQLLEADVRDRQDTDVGDVEDVVVDLTTGRVRYAVVDFEPGWFQADRLVVVPVQALRPKRDRGDPDLTFDGTRERLAQAPAFESNRWPDLDASGFRTTVDRWLSGWRTSTAPGASTTGARDVQGAGRAAGADAPASR